MSQITYTLQELIDLRDCLDSELSGYGGLLLTSKKYMLKKTDQTRDQLDRILAYRDVLDDIICSNAQQCSPCSNTFSETIITNNGEQEVERTVTLVKKVGSKSKFRICDSYEDLHITSICNYAFPVPSTPLLATNWRVRVLFTYNGVLDGRTANITSSNLGIEALITALNSIGVPGVTFSTDYTNVIITYNGDINLTDVTIEYAPPIPSPTKISTTVYNDCTTLDVNTVTSTFYGKGVSGTADVIVDGVVYSITDILDASTYPVIAGITWEIIDPDWQITGVGIHLIRATYKRYEHIVSDIIDDHLAPLVNKTIIYDYDFIAAHTSCKFDYKDIIVKGNCTTSDCNLNDIVSELKNFINNCNCINC